MIIDKKTDTTIHFTDTRHEYNFNISKSTLLKRFYTTEDKEIYGSSGSACSSNKPGLSNTLVAIGLDKELLDSTLRFSFCYETTKEELEYTIETLKQLLPMLRKYTRR